MKDKASSIKVELRHNSLTKGGHFLHEQDIIQDMAYRQFLMKYTEKCVIRRASRKYNKSRSYIYFWKSLWDGSVASGGPKATPTSIRRRS